MLDVNIVVLLNSIIYMIFLVGCIRIDISLFWLESIELKIYKDWNLISIISICHNINTP